MQLASVRRARGSFLHRLRGSGASGWPLEVEDLRTASVQARGQYSCLEPCVAVGHGLRADLIPMCCYWGSLPLSVEGLCFKGLGLLLLRCICQPVARALKTPRFAHFVATTPKASCCPSCTGYKTLARRGRGRISSIRRA